MFARCSEETLARRFHTAIDRVSIHWTQQLLCPPGGWSRVAEGEGSRDVPVIGMGMAAAVSPVMTEVGVIVEDGHQGQGIGTRILTSLADDAARRGSRLLRCIIQHDNEPALRAVRSAGRPSIVSRDPGLLTMTISLPSAAETDLVSLDDPSTMDLTCCP